MKGIISYLKKGKWRTDHFEHWLVLSLIVGFIGQAVFMSYSGSLFDLEFDAAHTLKKVSYLCVLTGLLISMYFAFQQVERSKIALAAINTQLTEANQAAEQEIARRKVAENVLRMREKAAPKGL